jgi:NAD+ kinase
LTLELGDARLSLPVKRVGILYYPQLEKARNLADKLEDLLATQGVSSWQCSAWDEDKAKPQVASSGLILSIGGDGTILHVARTIAPLSVPILGINLGRLGFITEMGSNEVLSKLPDLIKGGGWVEERAMLQAQLEDKSFYALNDVVVRSTAVRLVNIEVKIDGEPLSTYRADGIIIATATGSTAYSLAAGGPILHPQSKEIILQPISCHLGLSHSLVLPPQSIVDLKVASGDKAVLSFDGQADLPLVNEQNVEVKRSSYVTRFLRIHQPSYFYSSVWQKLTMIESKRREP